MTTSLTSATTLRKNKKTDKLDSEYIPHLEGHLKSFSAFQLLE